jgi:hypothetical protein
MAQKEFECPFWENGLAVWKADWLWIGYGLS